LRAERIGELEQRVAELEELVGRLVAENEELRRRVGGGFVEFLASAVFGQPVWQAEAEAVGVAGPLGA
jgi:hypothetical protein